MERHLKENPGDPFPTLEEKQVVEQETELTMDRINWHYCNARRRDPKLIAMKKAKRSTHEKSPDKRQHGKRKQEDQTTNSEKKPRQQENRKRKRQDQTTNSKKKPRQQEMETCEEDQQQQIMPMEEHFFHGVCDLMNAALLIETELGNQAKYPNWKEMIECAQYCQGVRENDAKKKYQ